MNDEPTIYTARRVSHNPEKHFYILSDGLQRFFASESLFPGGLSADRLVSFTVRPPGRGQKFPAVTQVFFELESEKI
jgi:hypothetical protein